MDKKTKFTALFVIQLVILLPLASALEISDVQSSDITDRMAKISWTTDSDSDSRVFYGTSRDNLALTKTEVSKTKQHSVLLYGLEPNKIYYYKVKSVDGASAENDNSGNYFAFQTLAMDTTLPYINVNVPEYSSRQRIDIAGTAKPMTRVDLYVNGIKQRTSSPDPGGEFDFPSVELSTFIVNQIRIEAIDASGNTAEKNFQTTVDVTEPSITTNTIPAAVTDNFFRLEGTLSEESVLEIKVNEELISQKQATTFSESIPLKEGSNELLLRAIDRAGNSNTITKTITVDTEAPRFEEITPRSGSFFYEGAAETDIKGKTEPFAEVFAYLDKEPDGRYNAKTKADSTGNFEFKGVDLEGPFYEAAGVRGEMDTSGYRPVSSEEVSYAASSAIQQGQEGQLKQQERAVKATLVAKDAAGHSTQEKLSYSIGTCYSGGMNWAVSNLIEYQSPTMLSPERLSEGTELISAIFDLKYMGIGTNPRIKSIKFEKACKASTMLTDERYNISCQALPASPSVSKSNDKGTLHYLRYNLKKYEGLNDFYKSRKDLTRELVFPLKVKINYVHQVDGKDVEEWQTSCINTGYAVDTSRIDPRDVLPDFMLNDGIGFLNTSITNLNSIISKVDVVLRYAAIACLVGFGLKVITVINRRWQSWTDYMQDKPLSWEDPTKCPIPRTRGKMNPGAQPGPDLTQEDLKNIDLSTRCPMAFAAWKTEYSAYKAYRWACDRFLCKGTPARWTEGVETEEVRIAIENNLWCSSEQGTEGAILRKPTPDDCKRYAGEPACWIYKNQYYILKEQKEETVILAWKNVENPIRPAGVENEIEVTLQSGNVMKYEPDKKCADLCKSKKYSKGECMAANDASNKIVNSQNDNKIMFQANECTQKNLLCVCWGADKEAGSRGPPQDTLDSIGGEGAAAAPEAAAEERWDYRYSKVGYQYDKYRYYKERDEMACFGMNNLVSKGDPYLSPSELVPAFQCLCISQIRNRLVVLRNILQGIYNCLQQIRTTGKADAGVCKEIFTQYICKWMYKLLSSLMKGCTPFGGSDKDKEAGVGDYLRAGTQAIYGGLEESASDIVGDYDSAELRDFIGIGEGAIANKICLGALTGDWGWDLEGFMDVAYSEPFYTSATAFPAQREYLTWNPDNDLAAYEYNTAWMITPGCDLAGYTVSLACVTDYEFYNFDNIRCEQLQDNPNAPPFGCDCVSASQGKLGKIAQDRTGPSKTIYTSRRLTQSTFQDSSSHVTDEQPYRYDHVKITVYAKNDADAKKCIPEKNRIGPRIGVFYAPISDTTNYEIAACRWNLDAGQFECAGGQILWSQRGRAYFGDIKCDEGEAKIECKEKYFYLGDQLKLDTVPIFVQGKKQCLHLEVKNGHGAKVYENDFEYNADPSDPQKWAAVPLPNMMLLKEGAIQESDFSQADPIARITPSGSGLAKEGASADVIFGNYTLLIRSVTSQGIDFSGEYSLTGGDIWIPFKKDDMLTLEGMNFRFSSKPLGVATDGTPKEFIILTSAPTQSVTLAPWHALLELRHAPSLEDADEPGPCTDSVKEDLISYQGVDQKMDIPLRVVPKTRGDAQACLDKEGTLKNAKACDCNGDDAPEEDCNGKYCYPDGVCRAYPRCKAGDVMNQAACDCNGDYVAEEDCKGKYCVNGWCTDQKAEIDRTLPAFNETGFVINNVPYSSYRAQATIEQKYTSDLEIELPVRDDVMVQEAAVEIGVGQNRLSKTIPVNRKEGLVSIKITPDEWIGKNFNTASIGYPFRIDIKDSSGNSRTVLSKQLKFI